MIACLSASAVAIESEEYAQRDFPTLQTPAYLRKQAKLDCLVKRPSNPDQPPASCSPNPISCRPTANASHQNPHQCQSLEGLQRNLSQQYRSTSLQQSVVLPSACRDEFHERWHLHH